MANPFSHYGNGVSTSSMTECIARIDARLNIGSDRSFFLLLQYEWDESKLAADLSCLQKAGVVLNRSVHSQEISETIYETCVACKFEARCLALHCHHCICPGCLGGIVREHVDSQTINIACPDCNCFVNPSFLKDVLSNDLMSQYTQLVFNDFMIKTTPTRLNRIQRAATFVCRHKTGILVGGLVVGGLLATIKGRAWIKDNPTTWAMVMILYEQVKDGQHPLAFDFWLQFLLKSKSKFGLKSFLPTELKELTKIG